jgi:DNA polymerase-1
VGTAAPPVAAQQSGSVNAVDAKGLGVAARGAGAAVEPGDDPQLMAYLLDAVTGGVEGLARRLGAGEWGDSAESRAVVGAELLALLRPQLEGPLLRIYQEIERPLQGVLAEMELAGIRLDLSALQRLKDEVAARMSQVEAQLKLVADDDSFNVASRDQVAQLLFQKLGLRGGRRTSTGKLSTAVGALEPLIGQHDAVDLILEHHELAKLHGTYIAPLAELADGQGRVHTTFLQTVVATGRLASVNPNLQSIPVRTPLGREVRRAFIASPGYKLLVADYSQIELRVLAHLTAEPALIDAFTRGEDIHSATAQAIYGVAADAVTPDLRRIAKTINFGILYGMGPQRLARELSLPYAQAERFIATYFARYPNVRRFIDETLARGRELGYVETLLGRRRSVLELQSPDRGTREAAERMTFNMPVQGSAADIVKLAMLRLAPALAERGGLLLLQVHDEVVAEVPERAADQLAQQVRHIMAEVYPLRVPLAARVGVGANWLEAG